MKRGRRSGGVLMETVIFTPFLLMLLVGMIQLGQVTYTYYALQKILYTLARYAGTQQGVDFCDDSDATVQAAKNYALTGTLDASANPIVAGLTADMLQIRAERYSSANGDIGQCSCSIDCDTTNGGLAPDFIVASIPGGYSYQLVFFGLRVDPILLRPEVRLPYGGT